MIKTAFTMTACIVLTGCGAKTSLQNQRPAELRHDEPHAAAALRYEQRLSEDRTIPPNALLNAKRQRDQLVAAQVAESSIHPSPAEALQWTWLGPGNVGGRLRAIVIHPTATKTIWVGSASGGIWKTTNGGSQWFPLDDFLPSLAIGCMAIDPTNPNTLYAGTGEGFFETVEGTSNTAAVRGAGIFKTLDGGATWNQLPSTAGPEWHFVNRIAIAPGQGQIMLAATGSGVYRTIDGGQTWTQAAAGHIYDVRFHPSNASLAIAAPHDDPPLYSTDGGVTWSASSGLTAHRVELAYAPNNPAIVYAAAANNNVIRVYRSLNGGQTYSLQTASGGISTYEAYNTAIWVDPLNSNHLIVGGISLYRSTDGGVSFGGAFNAVHADHHVITHDPRFDGVQNKVVYFGNDGGIHVTLDVYAGAAAPLNNNLGVTQFYGAAINPTTGVVVAGAQDNGTKRFSGNPQAWSTLFGGDGGFCAADPTDPNYFYGEVQRLLIFRSTNGGTSANYIYTGISDAGNLNCNFIPFFMLDPNEPNRMLAAGRRLWRSDNVKAPSPTWTAIKPTIETESSAFDPTIPGAHFAENSPFNISTIAVAEGNSNLVWVGHNNGQVWRTDNGTSSFPKWTPLDDGVTPLPNRWVSRIVIDPKNHEQVLVSFMGWTDNNVWRTTDGGLTWTDISGVGERGLPSAPVSSLAQDRRFPNRLYAGTDIGLFMTNNFGQTWWAASLTPGSCGTAPVDELVWKDQHTLMAVTHGRGVYLVNVTSPQIPGDADGDGVVNINDLLLVISAWGACPSPCPPVCASDFNGDCSVDINDLLTVITNWN